MFKAIECFCPNDVFVSVFNFYICRQTVYCYYLFHRLTNDVSAMAMLLCMRVRALYKCI